MNDPNIIAKANAERLAAAKAAANAELLQLRTTLAMQIAKDRPDHFVTPEDRPVQYGAPGTTETLLRITHAGITFTLRFCLEQLGRYSRIDGYRPVVFGSSYQRNGKTYNPRYAKRKDGTYNIAGLLADLDAHYERNQHANTMARLRSEQSQASEATFSRILADADLKPGIPGGSTARVNLGDFTVSISTGSIQHGKVRVQVSLRDEYLNGPQALALLKKLKEIV